MTGNIKTCFCDGWEGKSDKEILEFYQDKQKGFDTFEMSMYELLKEMEMSPNNTSFPDVYNELKDFPKSTKIRIYSKCNDNGEYITENVYLIEII